ncbi:MAG: T9SS type A sorting domain-containing protein, partial [Bacteroidota bacterium]|nr:T9SS type A sorting domain-containing protein [Bacteroidota bacterium]
AYDLLLSTGTIAGLVTVVGPVVTVTTSALASSDSDAVISVYPNPTENGEVTVVAPVGTAIVIYDLSGSVVKSATAVDNKTSISGLTPGFYIVKAGSKSLKLIVK